MIEIIAMFSEIDDFCLIFEAEYKKRLIKEGEKQRNKEGRLSISEIMTIMVWFHASGYRTFKDYYSKEVIKNLYWAFPKLVSYNRFVELMKSALVPLACYLETRFGACTGISFIDSTSIKVCHNRRIHSNKVFEAAAKRGKTSVDWFYGFKLHLVINDQGQLLGVRLTTGNVDDREVVEKITKRLWGKLFGDKGYISQQLFELLFNNGLQLITKVKSNMKSKLLPLLDKIYLRKRAIIESVNDQLKNISQIEHSRHRSLPNFLFNLISGLVSYTFRDKLPSIHFDPISLSLLPITCF